MWRRTRTSRVCGFGDAVPLTYPFALTFPTVMALVTGFDFPFAAMGSVHIENHITQYRPILVTDTVSVRVHAENLREHRRGLLVDIVTDVNVGNETAWHQVTTFLHQQKTSLADEPKPPQKKQPKLGPPNAGTAHHAGPDPPLRVGRRDHNPIHTNPIAAKLFGFPTVIRARNVSPLQRFWRTLRVSSRTPSSIRCGSPSRWCCQRVRVCMSTASPTGGNSHCVTCRRAIRTSRAR